MVLFKRRKKEDDASFRPDEVERVTLIAELESERNMCIDDIETVMHAISVETGDKSLYRRRNNKKKRKY